MAGNITMMGLGTAVLCVGIYLVVGGSLMSMTFVVAGGIFLALGIRQFKTAQNLAAKKNVAAEKGADNAR